MKYKRPLLLTKSVSLELELIWEQLISYFKTEELIEMGCHFLHFENFMPLRVSCCQAPAATLSFIELGTGCKQMPRDTVTELAGDKGKRKCRITKTIFHSGYQRGGRMGRSANWFSTAPRHQLDKFVLCAAI